MLSLKLMVAAVFRITTASARVTAAERDSGGVVSVKARWRGAAGAVHGAVLCARRDRGFARLLLALPALLSPQRPPCARPSESCSENALKPATAAYRESTRLTGIRPRIKPVKPTDKPSQTRKNLELATPSRDLPPTSMPTSRCPSTDARRTLPLRRSDAQDSQLRLLGHILTLPVSQDACLDACSDASPRRPLRRSLGHLLGCSDARL